MVFMLILSFYEFMQTCLGMINNEFMIVVISGEGEKGMKMKRKGSQRPSSISDVLFNKGLFVPIL